MKKLFALFFMFAGTAIPAAVCTFDTSNAVLPIANCQFKECIEGGDCEPPNVERNTARIEFYEPAVSWQEHCREEEGAAACWQARFRFRFRVWASDPSGIGEIGVHLAQESNNNRQFEKYFAQAGAKDEQGRYDATVSTVLYVPIGQNLQLSLFEICARDTNYNETCLPPDSELIKKKTR